MKNEVLKVIAENEKKTCILSWKILKNKKHERWINRKNEKTKCNVSRDLRKHNTSNL